MWDIKLKLTDTNNSKVITRGLWVERIKGSKYMMMEDDLTLGGGHTIQYTYHVSYKSTLETYIMLLTNVTPINSIKISKKSNTKKSLMYR